MSRPSDSAIAKAFFEKHDIPRGQHLGAGTFVESVIERAREIDASRDPMIAEAARRMHADDELGFICTGDEIRCLDGNGCECEMKGLKPARIHADSARLDSGMITIGERDSFGMITAITYTGIDLRAGIDAAMRERGDG